MAKRDERIQHGPPTEEEVYEALGLRRKDTQEVERRSGGVPTPGVRIPASDWLVPGSYLAIVLFVAGYGVVYDLFSGVFLGIALAGFVPYIALLRWEDDNDLSLSWWAFFTFFVFTPLLVWLAERKKLKS